MNGDRAESLGKALLQWRVGALFLAALFLRLLLAPYPGYVGDTKCMVQYARATAQGGLAAANEIPNANERYPPLFVYHAVLVGHLAGRQLQPAESDVIQDSSLAERVWMRAVPIGYDLLSGAALLLVLARLVTSRAGEVGAAIYLFNPGTILNASQWNYEAMPSFYLLLAVAFCGMALGTRTPCFWTLAWAAAGLAFCSKLQAGLILPVIGLLTLLTRRPKIVGQGVAVFLLVMGATYAPFVIGEQWDYLRRVFVVSFQTYAVTHAGAYNLWALWFQLPAGTTIAGVTLDNVGRALYLGAMAWLACQIWQRKVVNSAGLDGCRRAAIVAVYGCLAPFVLLTRMHERYIAPALAVCVLAAMLDRRLRGVMWGVSITYGLNLLSIMSLSVWHLWKALPEGVAPAEALHLSSSVVRFFCSALNVGLLAWLVFRLPVLLAPPDPSVSEVK